MQFIEDSVLFEQSIINIGEGQGKQIQLASDGKIYLFFRDAGFSFLVNNYVGVIHKPEKQGIACNHQPNTFTFTQGKVGRSFVNFAIDFLFRFDFELSHFVFLFKKLLQFAFNGADFGFEFFLIATC